MHERNRIAFIHCSHDTWVNHFVGSVGEEPSTTTDSKLKTKLEERFTVHKNKLHPGVGGSSIKIKDL